jgi:hypothetical protein
MSGEVNINKGVLQRRSLRVYLSCKGPSAVRRTGTETTMTVRAKLKNGVSEEGLRQLVEMGYSAEVVCIEAPVFTGKQCTGLWHIRAISPDGHRERVLVTQRDPAHPRALKTTLGLERLLVSLGCDGVSIPFVEGGRRANRLAEDASPGLRGTGSGMPRDGEPV